MSRVAFALLLLAVIRRGASEEAKWEQNDKDESGDKVAEARSVDGFRPHFAGPYGPNSAPIRPTLHNHDGSSELNIFNHRPGRPHYQTCRCSFNCPPGLIVVRRPDYYGGAYHLTSNNYVRISDNGGYQFPDYYQAHIGSGLDRQPNGLPVATHGGDVAIFSRSGNTVSREDEKTQDNTSS